MKWMWNEFLQTGRDYLDLLKSGDRFYLSHVLIPNCRELYEPVQAFINERAKTGGDFLRKDAEWHFREKFSTFDWVIEGM